VGQNSDSPGLYLPIQEFFPRTARTVTVETLSVCQVKDAGLRGSELFFAAISTQLKKGIDTMNRVASICLILIACCLVLSPMVEVSAQLVQIKATSISPQEYPKGVTTAGGALPVSGGLYNVPKGMRVYVKADTSRSGAAVANSFAWTITARPTGSTAAFITRTDSIGGFFIADSVGDYTVRVTVNGSKVANQTFHATTFVGVDPSKNFCGVANCHAASTPLKNAWTAWKTSKHATMVQRGINGLLEPEVNPYTGLPVGVYSGSCIKCHSTGWDQSVNNGNFGYVAHLDNGIIKAWDTTWYKSASTTFFNGEYLILGGDTTNYTTMKTSYPKLVGVAPISCEQCHGPAQAHVDAADPALMSVSDGAGTCNVCHGASGVTGKHSIGEIWKQSRHAKLPEGDHTAQAGCYPCHSGAAFVKWVKGGKSSTTVYDTTTVGGQLSLTNDGNRPIACPTCHEPHTMALRTTTLDSLKNGYKAPAGVGGAGLLCMNCHQSRSNVNTLITNTPPYYGFANRFGPHHSPQGDMFLGSNAYNYGDTTLNGLTTHGQLEDACVTCHMSRGNNLSSPTQPHHDWAMRDTSGKATKEGLKACEPCHGAINDYSDIRAFYDYDRNGKIEGAQKEVEGLLNALKAVLPKDANGNVISQKADFDTSKHYTKKTVGDIYNYFFVSEDLCDGIHNPKYTLRLLYKALGWTPLSVKELAGMPAEYALGQNYPNPFNPTTNIRFSLPTESHVKLEVYDITGALVKTILNEAVRAGNKEVAWDGLNNAGAKVASGMYLYRLEAGNFVSARKMLLLK
jgi:hypothetical protein